MTPLSDHLYAILHNNALSYDDHARLDGIGQAVSAPSLTARTVWGWRVAVDSQFVRITVACHRHGTGALPRPRDHLVALVSMTNRVLRVNGRGRVPGRWDAAAWCRRGG